MESGYYEDSEYNDNPQPSPDEQIEDFTSRFKDSLDI